ncbi:MAG: hypothetical protein J7K95_02255, partial [Thermoplasmata archaeon]|nr:hypothetical protein [Thermoplasmata archaeon]
LFIWALVTLAFSGIILFFSWQLSDNFKYEDITLNILFVVSLLNFVSGFLGLVTGDGIACFLTIGYLFTYCVYLVYGFLIALPILFIITIITIFFVKRWKSWVDRWNRVCENE